MKKNALHIVCSVLTVIFVYSCATKPKRVETEKLREIPPVTGEADKVPAPKKDETKSLELFSEVLELVESTADRKSVLPKIEELYNEIIEQYPDAPLAQESYWKLITIYVQDYSPPAYDRAKTRYEEFKNKYPQSFLQGFIEDTLGNSYYKNGEWDSLLELTMPSYREYVEKGKEPRASMMFMYSEAKYNMGFIEEAEEGYAIVAKLFPKLIVGIRSKKMLSIIEKIRIGN
jgi:tetratricopeptide (TPR) repeat protein